MNPAHQQHGWTVRFDSGLSGAAAVGLDAGFAVVVDVLSFTTSLSVAVDRGIEVLPFRWRDESAAAYAGQHDAVLAVGRREAVADSVSLSPGSIRRAVGLDRLVLPSPNGSAIAHSLAESARVCVGASLRNARAVAEWIAANDDGNASVAIIAAGERWPDGTLRPAVEDVWGAGAVLAELGRLRPGWAMSPESEMAVAAWRAVRKRVGVALEQCASGRELTAAGYGPDVRVAAEVDESCSVPVLVGGVFVDRGQRHASS
ncbi:2-phosphosulfolactate phosphatase [Rhodococcus sp. SGAir0479]|uniref:2-phosphosulfolactate phosphatase n=1 Tax=Rhodococcus sp. SGAir0479 TaxID=2567884 RepID=UPI0010CCE9F7|nr:2-phosphosulfolactate phosphatase [Rhodococcus sp. SGAir0479]QCQ91393.1 2-phosphosulfolactate phosphatase [Rhodococcus sp. SGAir0479]